MTCLVGNVNVVFVVKGAEGRWHIFELILDTILILGQRSELPNGLQNSCFLIISRRYLSTPLC